MTHRQKPSLQHIRVRGWKWLRQHPASFAESEGIDGNGVLLTRSQGLESFSVPTLRVDRACVMCLAPRSLQACLQILPEYIPLLHSGSGSDAGQSPKTSEVDVDPRLAALRLSDGESERLALAAGFSAVARFCEERIMACNRESWGNYLVF